MKSRLAMAILYALLSCGIAHAQLSDVGNGLINHPAANMTWVADGLVFRTEAAANPDLVDEIIANWRGSLPFDHVLVEADFGPADGSMNYWGALAWIHHLNVTNYKGYNDWRLPDIGPPRPPGSCGGACYPFAHSIPVSSSEWFRLFYDELGGAQGVPISVTHNSSYDLFQSIGFGWSRNGSGDLYNQFFQDGGQGRNPIALFSGAWPVRSGLSVINPPPMGNLALSLDEHAFAAQPAGTNSTARTIEITSIGTGPFQFDSIATDGDFIASHDCPVALAIGASCSVEVVFAPTDVGVRTGSLAITGANRTYTVALSGAGSLTIELAANVASATAGMPVVLTWTSPYGGVACSGSGGSTADGWAGPILPTGAASVTSEAPGTVNYTAACLKNGVSAQDSVTVVYTVPAATIAAASTNLTFGQSNTLTWSSTDAESCAASGNGAAAVWNGAKATAGTATIIETTPGLITYTITCTSGPRSAEASIQVFVGEAPDTGGGGSSGLLALFGLLLAVGKTTMSRVTARRVLQHHTSSAKGRTTILE